MIQTTLGEMLKQEGITNSVTNANNKIEAWSDRAYFILLNYIMEMQGTFMTEDIREYAGKRGLAEPPSKRAWGAIILRAKKEGRVRFVGYDQVNNPKAHRANAARWQASIQ